MRTQTLNRSMLAIYVALIIAELTSAFELTMTVAALPTFYRIFNDPIGAGWLLTGFGLVAASSAAICGRLGDLYGRKRVLMIVLAICGIGSAISAFSTTLAGVVIGRAIQGVSGAILPLCFGLVRENVRREQVPVGIGIMSAIAAGGSAAGLLFGGFIVDNLSWHSIFYASAVNALLGIIAIGSIIPASIRMGTRRRLDVLGGVLFAPPIAGILYAVGQARVWGWLDARTLGLLAACFLALAFWAWYELRQPDPLIDVRLIMKRQVGLANLCTTATSLGPFQMTLVVTLLLQAPTWTNVGFGLSASAAGAILALPALVGVIGGPWSGLLAARRGGRQAMIYGAVFMIVCWAFVTIFHSSLWVVLLVVMLSGLATSVVFAAGPNLIVEAAPDDRTSEATGLSSVFRQTFMGVGAQILTFLLATSTISDPSKGKGIFPADAAFTLSFAFITAAAVVCLLIAFALPRRRLAAVRELEVPPIVAAPSR